MVTKKLCNNVVQICVNHKLIFKSRCLCYRYAKSVGAKHFHTSAKLNKGVEDMFLELSHRMMERAQENDLQKASALGRSSSMRRNVVVVDDEAAISTQAETKSSCCGGAT